MGEIEFGDNYSDMCISSGLNAGFQFQFHCERCNDAWRSSFVAYSRGQASGWLSKASGLLGGITGTLGEAVDGLAESGWGAARDEAFREAIAQAKKHFNRCARCTQYVCARCFNKAKGLCLNCAPSAEVEIEAARSAGEVDAAREVADAEGRARGAKREVKRARQLVCPACGAETHGAKFCPECGEKLAVEAACADCGAKLTPGAKFCPECGAKQAGR